MSHPEYVLPNTPHAGYRYKMAMKHVEAAKAAGKSVEEIHEIFNSVMNYDIDNLPDDAAHKNYKNAVEQAKAAMAEENPIKKCMSCFKKC